FNNVSFTRRAATIWNTAMTPDIMALTNNTPNISRQPNTAPIAPINFQSPAPNPRSSTNGSKRPSARPAPSSEFNAPSQPFSVALAVRPARAPDTVSQFGIRPVRKSKKPP